jgi:glycyl-tRNA synthetase
MSKPLDFQSMILTLQHFWAEQGCLIWQPYYQQVGAGTLNPATALRVLGPEPWNVAYVEPSIRPDDGRYGENPNRMQMHYQFQVILKPDPGDPQEKYLRSLEALGIDPRQHDIRFVEDNWESPALGAWGLGWEVWLDGQEITQFTYFQQAGGKPVDPVAVEITYGLDRIAITLQRVHGFTEIRWNDQLTCGDINLQAEQEQCAYYFDIADVERLKQMYDLYQKEADVCLSRNLVLPAHDYMLKCSHTFNVLDSRGAVGLTERQAFFGRMRDLSRRIADAYLEKRQHLEYPFLKEISSQASTSTGVTPLPSPLSPAPFLLEIGTEELPSGDLDSALEQLRARVPALLDELRLTHGVITVVGTPRRLVVAVEKLAERQPDQRQVVKGPPAERAFDSLGQPTKAGEGFARSKGVPVSDLKVAEMDGGRYVTAEVFSAGGPTPEVLRQALPGLVGSLRFDKSMRWNASNVPFSRPLRWLLALYGEIAIPFSFAGVASGNTTRGLRFRKSEQLPVRSPAEYFRLMSAQGIVLDKRKRQAQIFAHVRGLAEVTGGQLLADDGLLSEVANLVEAPTALRGSFDPAHLSLPREVLISVMKKHQRYFPVVKRGDADTLLPYFITVINKPSTGDDPFLEGELVVEGNEHVLRARFADADFFVRDDRKHKLADFLPRLGTLIFQTKLGSMLDKSRRVTALVQALAAPLGLDAQTTAVAARAAELCKADLATRMVIEMTALQGIIGRYYALASGESEAVAQAIFEHTLPRFAGDALPESKPGLVVGVADRLDTLAGLFAAGLAPTGAKDPFAQRRAALGLVQALCANALEIDLRPALAAAAARLPIPASAESQAACLDFIVERLRNWLLESGERFDVVDAVVSLQGENPARAAQAVRQLSAWIARPDWNRILPAYARCVRIMRSAGGAVAEAYKPLPGTEPAEQELYAALQTAEETLRQLPGSRTPDDFLNAFLPMIPAVDRFFEAVLVMVDEAQVRLNRLALMGRIAALAQGVADLAKLEGF